MQNLSWIDISMNSRGQWKCEYTSTSINKKITKTYPRKYRKMEALFNFKSYINEVIKKAKKVA